METGFVIDAERVNTRADWQFDLGSLLFLVTVVSVSLGVGRSFNFAWGSCVLFYGTATFFAARNWSGFLDSFTVWQGLVFFVLWFGFSLMSCLILSRGFDEQRNVVLVLGNSAACITGPFFGAISRQMEPSCLEFGIVNFPYSALGLGFASLLHAVIRPNSWIDAVRLFFLTVGLILWFCGGVASLMMMM